MAKKLETSYQIIRYVKDLSFFVDSVRITKVIPGELFFEVRVSFWYKLFFYWRLKRKIQEGLSERMYDNISFKFKIISIELF